MATRSVTLRALALVAIFGFIWAKALGLTQFADPTYIDWMVESDWMGELFGWLFARSAPWSIPFASAPALVWPQGSSAALTEALPSLTVFGKVLSPFFGERFQLFGAWMVLGVVATGVAGVLVCRPWFKDTASLALAGCLFVLNPVVSTRYGHPPFFAFWVITGLVGACLWPVSSLTSARRTAAVTLGICLFISATTSYLTVMSALLVAASITRLTVIERHFKAGEAIAWLVASPLVCLTTLWLFGFIAGVTSAPMSNLAIEGFGQFSADLLTFVNPLQWSRFFPAIAMGPRQYEGFAYLGLGTLLLLALRLALLTKFRPTRAQVFSWLPLGVAITLMAIYSLSNHVTVAGKPIADFSSFYARLGPWPSVFRSSGRFTWPLFAWVTMVAVLGAALIKTAWARQFVLGGAVLLQLTDFDPTRTPLHQPFPPFVPLADPAWQLMKDYKHLVLQPVQIQWACPFDTKLVAKLSWEVYRLGLTINSGHVGRTPPGIDCNRHLAPGELDDETVYLPYFAPFVADFTNAGFVCGPIEGRVLCVSPRRQTALSAELLRRSAPR